MVLRLLLINGIWRSRLNIVCETFSVLLRTFRYFAYTEIADQYFMQTINASESWGMRFGWENGQNKTKCMMTAPLIPSACHYSLLPTYHQCSLHLSTTFSSDFHSISWFQFSFLPSSFLLCCLPPILWLIHSVRSISSPPSSSYFSTFFPPFSFFPSISTPWNEWVI